MKIVVLEKRKSIGEVNGIELHTWDFLQVMKQKDLSKWCKDRGYADPYVIGEDRFIPVYVDIRATIVEL